MKRFITLAALLWTISSFLFAQPSLMIERVGNVTDYIPTADIEEITFSDDLSQFIIKSNSCQVCVNRDEVLNMGYAEAPSVFQVEFNGVAAKIRNPYLLQGVTVCLALKEVE